MRLCVAKQLGLVLGALALAACGPASKGAAEEELIPNQAQLVRTHGQFSPGPARLSWTGGFSDSDVWIGLADGGALRMQGDEAPQPVPELDLAKVGGTLSSPAFLDSGEAFFTVFRGADEAHLLRWKDGKVDERTSEVAPDAAAFASTLRVLARTPGGELVAVVHDAADQTLLRAFAWKSGRFEKSAELRLPADTALARVTPTSASTCYVLSADTSGAYSIRFFDGTTLKTVLDNAPQLSGAFLPTSRETGFVAVQGMSFWDGKGLVSAALPPASPVYLPFAPDGLASIATTGGAAGALNPRIFVQHGTQPGEKFRVGAQALNARLRWLSAGVVGTRLFVVVDGTEPTDPAIVSVELGAAP